MLTVSPISGKCQASTDTSAPGPGAPVDRRARPDFYRGIHAGAPPVLPVQHVRDTIGAAAKFLAAVLINDLRRLLKALLPREKLLRLRLRHMALPDDPEVVPQYHSNEVSWRVPPPVQQFICALTC